MAVYLISGATSGLGYDLLKTLSDKSNILIIVGRSSTKLNELATEFKTFDNYYLNLDLNDVSIFEEQLKLLLEKVGSINGVIHAVGGGLGLKSPILSVPEVIELLEANLFFSLTINRLILPLFIEKKSGRIIHIGSTAANQAIGSVGYNVAKASLDAYVRSLGNYCAQFGVVVCGINPGAFLANNNSMERLKKVNLSAYLNFESKLPRKRMAKSYEIINIIQFLLSDQAEMLGGTMISVDAGEGTSYK